MRGEFGLLALGVGLVAVLTTAAIAQPRAFVVKLGDDPSLPQYQSGATVITAQPGDQVCVGLYVQGGIECNGVLTFFDTRDSAPNDPVSGTVQADCATIMIDTQRGDYIGFPGAETEAGLCDQDPFWAGYLVFHPGGESELLPPAPDGLYFGELCYDVSPGASGDFDFLHQEFFDPPAIFDEFGSPVPDAVFDGLTIHVVPPGIPTLTHWGLLVMALLGLIAGTVAFARRRVLA